MRGANRWDLGNSGPAAVNARMHEMAGDTGIRLLKFFLSLALSSQAWAQETPATVPAADGVFAAFATHPLVGIGEWHGLAQEIDFYADLIRDPRFARDVGNLVLETGSASQQATVDRYVNGDSVPYAELRRVWTDQVGWIPTVTYIGSINVYAAVRAVNLTLPPEQRIKVWLGEPPIDWSQIKTQDDWQPLLKERDHHPADLIAREILAKGKKALVIYGGAHMGLFGADKYFNLRAQIDAKQPGAWFIVVPYVGFLEKPCTARFERDTGGWRQPVLARVTDALKKRLLPPGCSIVDLPPNANEQQRKSWEAYNTNFSGLTADAVLYLGPRASLTRSPIRSDLYLDQDFRNEIDRRNRIMTGKPLTQLTEKENIAAPRPFFPD